MIKVIVAFKPFSMISMAAMTREKKKYKSYLSKYFDILGLAKRVTRHDPFTTQLTSDPFSLNPDTTRLTKRVGAPYTTRPVKFHGSPNTTHEPV
jgi:hypothetical protein